MLICCLLILEMCTLCFAIVVQIRVSLVSGFRKWHLTFKTSWAVTFCGKIYKLSHLSLTFSTPDTCRGVCMQRLKCWRNDQFVCLSLVFSKCQLHSNGSTSKPAHTTQTHLDDRTLCTFRMSASSALHVSNKSFFHKLQSWAFPFSSLTHTRHDQPPQNKKSKETLYLYIIG